MESSEIYRPLWETAPSIRSKISGRKPSLGIWKHTLRATRCFFFHYFLATSTTSWAKIFTDLFFCAICFDTPSENTVASSYPSIKIYKTRLSHSPTLCIPIYQISSYFLRSFESMYLYYVEIELKLNTMTYYPLYVL